MHFQLCWFGTEVRLGAMVVEAWGRGGCSLGNGCHELKELKRRALDMMCVKGTSFGRTLPVQALTVLGETQTSDHLTHLGR